MEIIDLKDFSSDEIIVHLGGNFTSINAYTFAKSLVAIADTTRTIGLVLDGQTLEVRIEAVQRGSVRARLKLVKDSAKELLPSTPKDVIWGVVLSAMVTHAYSTNQGHVTIEHCEGCVIVQGEDHKITYNEKVFDKFTDVQKSSEVEKNVKRTFQVLSSDNSVEEFGFYDPGSGEPKPIAIIPSKKFPSAETPWRTEITREILAHGQERGRRERLRLTVEKLWLRRADRKWSFDWGGMPVNGLIKDIKFLSKINSREIVIASGDALDALVEYTDTWDADSAMHHPDPNSFDVIEVFEVINAGRPKSLQLD